MRPQDYETFKSTNTKIHQHLSNKQYKINVNLCEVWMCVIMSHDLPSSTTSCSQRIRQTQAPEGLMYKYTSLFWTSRWSRPSPRWTRTSVWSSRSLWRPRPWAAERPSEESPPPGRSGPAPNATTHRATQHTGNVTWETTHGERHMTEGAVFNELCQLIQDTLSHLCQLI